MDIQESDLFEKKEEDNQKHSPQIGKLKTKELFNESTEGKGIIELFIFRYRIILILFSIDVKFYKPSIQPKKMKIQNPFPESEDFQNVTGDVV